MRESIGTSFLLNFIIVFIIFVFAFLAGTLSYYKAYKVNNSIIHAIEKFEGYNAYSVAEIKVKLKNYGYPAYTIDCPKLDLGNVDEKWSCLRNDFDTRDVSKNPDCRSMTNYEVKDGYCVYLYFNEDAPDAYGGGKSNTDIHYTYGVMSYLRIQIPLIGGVLKIPVFTKTYNMYYFPNQK